MVLKSPNPWLGPRRVVTRGREGHYVGNRFFDPWGCFFRRCSSQLQCLRPNGRFAVSRGTRFVLQAIFLGPILAVAAQASVSAADMPPLIPMPKSISVVPACRLARHLTVSPTVDPGGLDILADRLRAAGLPAPSTAASPIVRVELKNGPPARYALSVTSSSVRIVAAGGESEMDALATLAQLVRRDGTVPCVRIVDEPALADRFFSDDVSHGAIPTMDAETARIRRLAALKINGYSPYFENVVRRAGHENETRADGFTQSQLQKLVAVCHRFHMLFIPEQESFGHLQSLLQNAAYADVRESTGASSDLISPAVPRSYKVLRELFRDEFAGVRGLTLVHIGGDEPFELGKGKSSQMVRERGYARVYGEHMAKVATIVHALGWRPLMWGNTLVEHPSALRYLPRDMIVVPFDYDAEASFARLILPAQHAGFGVLVAPSVSTYDRFFPDLQKTTSNIDGFLRDAKRYRALGMFLTQWGGSQGELFDASWYPISYGAARAWETGGDPDGAFCPRYARLVYAAERACAVYRDLGALAADYRRAFPRDTLETLMREDWRVPYVRERVAAPGKRWHDMILTHTAALQRDVATLSGGNSNEVATIHIAAMRYRLFADLLTGRHPAATLVSGTRALHLSQWVTQNRPLSPTDRIENDYEAFSSPPRSNATAFTIPPLADQAAGADFTRIHAEIVAADAAAADPRFLLKDPITLLRDKGIAPAEAGALSSQVAANANLAKGDNALFARVLMAEIHRAEMPDVVKHAYSRLLSLGKRSNASAISGLVSQISGQFYIVETDSQGLAAALDVIPNRSSGVLQGLKDQTDRAKIEVACFQTYVNEWQTYGDAPGSVRNDPRARLPSSVRAAFCEP